MLLLATCTVQGLDCDHLVIEHIQVNRAPQMRRRTYRAHGRINGELTYFTICTSKAVTLLCGILAYYMKICKICWSFYICC